MSTTTRKARVARAAAVAVIAGSAIGGVATSSQAAATMMLGYNQNSGFLGIEEWSGYPYGRGICMDGGAAEPDVNMIAFSATQVADASVGWMMNQYLYTGDQVTAAALAYNVKQIYDPVALGRIMNNLSNTYGSGAAAAVVDRANSMQAEAAAAKGPYVGHVSMTFDANQRQGMITNVGVTSASGGWYAGHWLRLTLNGPAVFYNNSNVLDVQSTSSAQAHGWRATGSGQVSVTLTSVYTNLPPINFIMDAPPWDASPNGSGSTVGYQRAGRGSDEYLSVNAYDPGGMAQVEYEPKVSTQTSQANVNAGTVLSDTVSVTGGPPNTEVTVTNTLWGPFDSAPAQSTTLPSADKNVGTATTKVTLDAKGAGTATSTGVTVPGRGYYVWTESLAAGADAAGVPWKAFQGDFGVATETSLSHGAIVGSTQTSRQTANGGMALTDTIDITGAFKGYKGTITAQLYGPLKPVTGTTCEAMGTEAWTKALEAGEVAPHGEAVVIEVEGTEDGNVTVTTPEVETGGYGCYSWGEVLTNDVTGEDDDTTIPGEEDENTLIVEPEMITQSSKMVALPGAKVYDTIQVSGIHDEEATMEATFWGVAKPDLAKDCTSLTEEDWAKLIKDGTVKEMGAPEVIEVTGDGEYKTKEMEVKEIGCYTWSEKLTLHDVVEDETLPKDKQVNIVAETLPGVVEETTLVIKPEITTVAKANGSRVDAIMTDDITVKGLHNQPATITGQVFGPLLRNADGTCEGLDWSTAAKAADIAPIKITADGTFTSSEFKIPATGCYTYVEQLTIDSNKEEFANTKPGEVTETLYFQDRARGGGDGIAAGIPDAVFPAAGLGLIALGAGVYLVTRRRKGEQG